MNFIPDLFNWGTDQTKLKRYSPHKEIEYDELLRGLGASLVDIRDFKKKYNLAKKIYFNSPMRNSGHHYAVHPLRMVYESHLSGFRDILLFGLIYSHDVLEILKEGKINNSRSLVNALFYLFEDEEMIDLLYLTPFNGYSKLELTEKILHSNRGRSIITKVLDVRDNSLDQRKAKPQGVQIKVDQAELVKDYLLKYGDEIDFSNIQIVPEDPVQVLLDINRQTINKLKR